MIDEKSLTNATSQSSSPAVNTGRVPSIHPGPISSTDNSQKNILVGVGNLEGNLICDAIDDATILKKLPMSAYLQSFANFQIFFATKTVVFRKTSKNTVWVQMMLRCIINHVLIHFPKQYNDNINSIPLLSMAFHNHL